MYNVSYELIDILTLEQQSQQQNAGKNHWNTERFFCSNNEMLSFLHVCVCVCERGCIFHWHINMFDLYFCFLKRKKSKENNINLRTDWLTASFFSWISLLQNKSKEEKKRKCFAMCEKKRHSKVYYKFTLTLQTYAWFDNVHCTMARQWMDEKNVRCRLIHSRTSDELLLRQTMQIFARNLTRVVHKLENFARRSWKFVLFWIMLCFFLVCSLIFLFIVK